MAGLTLKVTIFSIYECCSNCWVGAGVSTGCALRQVHLERAILLKDLVKRFWIFELLKCNLDSTLKNWDITLPTKVHLVKAIVFPVVMYGCESWTIKKAEHRRIDAFEVQCWRRLLRVSWTARRSNQSILKQLTLNIHWKDWCGN